MERVNKILNHPTYKILLEELRELEKERVFCKHSLVHFLDVARIAYIKVLEKGLSYKKEIIYAIALLHDIGRVEEYKNGTDHNIASVNVAQEILMDLEFSKEEIDMICKCIKEHRIESQDELSKIIYESDKSSRTCFNCDAFHFCKWPKEKKNTGINN